MSVVFLLHCFSGAVFPEKASRDGRRLVQWSSECGNQMGSEQDTAAFENLSRCVAWIGGGWAHRPQQPGEFRHDARRQRAGGQTRRRVAARVAAASSTPPAALTVSCHCYAEHMHSRLLCFYTSPYSPPWVLQNRYAPRLSCTFPIPRSCSPEPHCSTPWRRSRQLWGM